jgi:hypothetical protein
MRRAGRAAVLAVAALGRLVAWTGALPQREWLGCRLVSLFSGYGSGVEELVREVCRWAAQLGPGVMRGARRAAALQP